MEITRDSLRALGRSYFRQGKTYTEAVKAACEDLGGLLSASERDFVVLGWMDERDGKND